MKQWNIFQDSFNFPIKFNKNRHFIQYAISRQIIFFVKLNKNTIHIAYYFLMLKSLHFKYKNIFDQNQQKNKKLLLPSFGLRLKQNITQRSSNINVQKNLKHFYLFFQ